MIDGKVRVSMCRVRTFEGFGAFNGSRNNTRYISWPFLVGQTVNVTANNVLGSPGDIVNVLRQQQYSYYTFHNNIITFPDTVLGPIFRV